MPTRDRRGRGQPAPPRRKWRPQAPGEQIGRRAAALRAQLAHDPAGAGDQALKLLEEYLEGQARALGYHGDGSIGRYTMFLRGNGDWPAEVIERLESYTQVRNCLAHTYGLQVSPALAGELIEFIERLFREEAHSAEQLMTRDVRTVDLAEPLARVRSLMLVGGYGRLPVLEGGDGIVGLLTERDVVAAQAAAEQSGRPFADLRVSDALPDEARERVALVAPGTPRALVAEQLRQPGIVACLVTPNGLASERPVGIITHADLLLRM